MKRRTVLGLFAVSALLSACGKSPRLPGIRPGETVLAFGDSVTFGTGASAGEDWPALLAKRTGWHIVNDEALAKTRETGKAHYWSRSRKKLWLKGESSGHFQRVLEIRIDCDEDAVLLLIEQEGGACHTGYRSCFYRTLDGKIVGEKVFDPEDVY